MKRTAILATLVAAGMATAGLHAQGQPPVGGIEQEAIEATAKAVAFAEESPLPNESELMTDVFA